MAEFDQNVNHVDPSQQPVDVNATPSQEGQGPDTAAGTGSANGTQTGSAQQTNANPYSNTGYSQPNGNPYSNTGSYQAGNGAGQQAGPGPNYYNQYQYQQPYNNKIDPEKSHNEALISLILGITSVILCWLGYGAIMGIVTGVAAIVLAVLSSKKSPSQKMESMAIAGLILGICGCAFSVMIIACTAWAIGFFKDAIHSNWGSLHSFYNSFQ